MALTLSRLDRKYRTYLVSSVDEDGDPYEPTGVDAALVAPSTGPRAATVWAPLERRSGFRVVGADWSILSTHTTLGAAVTASNAAAGSRVVTPWRALLAGPDASPTDALVVSADGADTWLRVVDNPEVSTALVESVSVTE